MSGKYSENSAQINKKDLENILEEVNFEHFKEIEDYETLNMAMDNLICRVDEKISKKTKPKNKFKNNLYKMLGLENPVDSYIKNSNEKTKK